MFQHCSCNYFCDRHPIDNVQWLRLMSGKAEECPVVFTVTWTIWRVGLQTYFHVVGSAVLMRLHTVCI